MSEDTEKEAAWQLAEEAGVVIDKRWSVEKIMSAIDAVQAKAAPAAEPEAEAPVVAAPEPVPVVEPVTVPEGFERVPPMEAIANKLVAYGVSSDQHPDTLDEREKLLQIVIKARRKEAEKRAKAAEGDYYGKTAKVRITRLGDGKVGTGRYIAGIGNLCYDAGDTPELDLLSAETLQERGFVEII